MFHEFPLYLKNIPSPQDGLHRLCGLTSFPLPTFPHGALDSLILLKHQEKLASCSLTVPKRRFLRGAFPDPVIHNGSWALARSSCTPALPCTESCAAM